MIEFNLNWHTQIPLLKEYVKTFKDLKIGDYFIVPHYNTVYRKINDDDYNNSMSVFGDFEIAHVKENDPIVQLQ